MYSILDEAGIDNVVLECYEDGEHSKYIYQLFGQEDAEIFDALENHYQRCLDLKRYQQWLRTERTDQPSFVEYRLRADTPHVPCALESDFQR